MIFFPIYNLQNLYEHGIPIVFNHISQYLKFFIPDKNTCKYTNGTIIIHF